MTTTSNPLNARDNWKLAALVMFIFYPVLLYIDLPVYLDGGATWPAMIVHESINIVVVICFLFVWVTAAEKCLNVLTQKLGDNFLHGFRVIPISILVLIAFILAITFILATGEVLKIIDQMIVGISGVKLLVSFPRTASHDFFQLFKRANIGFFFLIMFSAFYLIANRRAGRRLNELTLKAERIEKEKTVAQLEVLRSQVNPHFLFNSLSILTTLVHDDAALSEKFISELSKFYRYSLDEGKNETVSLSTELEFMQSYLFLLNIRFGEKLHCSINIPETQLTKTRVAPLTLQMLLENAVNHNQMSDSRPLNVNLFVSDNYLVIENSIHEKTQRIISTKTGLKNIIDRYELLTSQPVVVNSNDKTLS